ncbi:PIN-like domain-containing protein [Amycolatopsis sp. NPDC021455]|uniref:PIN-like domain-containing protein n=1 Tax=Amycolatopsis sp. NPDC021455 TaxID=3154901 RepID=UPI0033EF30F9
MAIDANVLLNLYRYNDDTTKDLIGVLQMIGDRLWVPHQAIREFWRNRMSVLTSRETAASQAITAFAKQRRATEDAIRQWAKATAIDAALRDEWIEKAKNVYGELEDAVRLSAPAVPAVRGGARDEPVLVKLEALLAGKVGAEPDLDSWQDGIKEGNRRAVAKEPPGYLDAEKVASDLQEGAAGDYLVWSQIMSESARRGLDVLLITGDEKEDWWWRHRSDFLGPRTELVTELKKMCGRQLYLMRPVDVLRRASVLQIHVRSESVDDAARVSREAQAKPLWSADGVAQLLERLDVEGWEQADVIRAAARSGGTIDRQAVYEIAQYNDDRMLRGFTRPAARITRDLQAEGVVADGVQPALAPIYQGSVKAAAFRIPVEMVAILADDETSDDGTD